jgi:hypothetical protein
MGTDRVRITDPKYMNLLMKKLDEEERKDWIRRSTLRKKVEEDRFRQLAVEGLMEPGPELQDLLQHPVFR